MIDIFTPEEFASLKSKVSQLMDDLPVDERLSVMELICRAGGRFGWGKNAALAYLILSLFHVDE